MKAILIDAAAREIREVDYTGYKDISKAVGGFICVAGRTPGGGTLYVNDEGLLNPVPHWFRWKLRGDTQPLNGNGFLVGREIGDTPRTRKPSLSLAKVRELVEWLTPEQVSAWAKAHASDPASTITTFKKDGTVKTEVTATIGSLFKAAPGDKP